MFVAARSRIVINGDGSKRWSNVQFKRGGIDLEIDGNDNCCDGGNNKCNDGNDDEPFFYRVIDDPPPPFTRKI